MSEGAGLGDTDADNRWIGIRRHQALLIIVGVGLCGDWLISSRTNVVELVVGVGMLVTAVPTIDGLTLGQLVAHVVSFMVRAHWGDVSSLSVGDDIELWSKGHAAFRCYEYVHRGRLDLSGRDASLAESVIALVDSLSAANSDTHLSQHVLRSDGDVDGASV